LIGMPVQVPAQNADIWRQPRVERQMSHDDVLPVSVIALRAEGYSPDGTSVIISLRTKFSSAERKYSVPIECFQDLSIDLQRLNASANNKSKESSLQQEETPIAAE